MERIRAFIAIELPEEVKRTLMKLQERLKSGCRAPVRWTSPDNTHLTLKFLGDIESTITDRIITSMVEAARGIRPFRLSISGLGVFPDTRRVRVVWVGLTGELDRINQLQKNIEAALTRLGFSAEARAFAPHLTLGRIRDQARPDERQSLGQLVSGMSVETGGGFEVKAVHLIRSQLRPEGPIYTRVGSVELK